MIDLHIHSTYSDGEKTVKELLEKADKLNLKYIAITDHNTINAYDEILEVKDDYNVSVIKGVEITTIYEDTIIEILAYNFDLNKMKKCIEEDYLKLSKERLDYEINFLKRVADKYNLKYDEKVFSNLNYSRFSVPIFLEEICKYDENKERFMRDAWNDGNIFFRKYILDKSSEWSFNSSKYYPKAETVLRDIHDSNGIAFIAHPYDYKIKDVNKMIIDLKKIGLDGIEIYHPSADSERRKKLIEIAKRENMYMSGGSDYHGKHEPKKLYMCGEIEIGYEIDLNHVSKWLIK